MMFADLLALLRHASPLPFYLLVSGAAGIQNVVPLPVADLLVLFGAFLAATSLTASVGVFLAAWLGNASVAALMYMLARHYRARCPHSRLVRWVLGRHAPNGEAPPRRWDLLSVFAGAFLPVRPLLPIYAGLGGIPFWRLILPLAAAAGAWYVGVVLVGATGGRSFEAVSRTFAHFNQEVLVATLVLLPLIVLAWLLRRRLRRRS